MTNSETEFYSDDSLEVVKKPNRKLKSKKVEAKKKQSYLQLYQHRLASEFTKLNVSNDSVCHTTRCNSPAATNSEENSLKKSISQTVLSEAVPKMWSEFLLRKYKVQRPKSEAEKKADMLKKRLEYGKRMTQINKFNIMCLSAEPVRNVLKANKPIETAKIPTPPVAAVPVPEEKKEETSRMVEINAKLALLKRRHLSDKKIVEKIKADLKITDK